MRKGALPAYSSAHAQARPEAERKVNASPELGAFEPPTRFPANDAPHDEIFNFLFQIMLSKDIGLRKAHEAGCLQIAQSWSGTGAHLREWP